MSIPKVKDLFYFLQKQLFVPHTQNLITFFYIFRVIAVYERYFYLLLIHDDHFLIYKSFKLLTQDFESLHCNI